jgi:Flp pilus assembly protein TadD
LQTAEEIMAVAPRDPQARLLHAVCLTGAGQYQRARTELNGLAAQFPKSPQVQFRLGVLAISERKFDEAEEIFRRLETSAGSDPAVFAGLAEAYRGRNESAKAIELLQGELKRNPGSPLLHQVLARVAASSGRFDLAIDQYRQLVAAQPRSLEAQSALAASYRAAGDVNSAIELLEKSVQAHPESAETSFQLAQALASAGRVNEAKVQYRHVLQLQPDNPRALNDLAYLMADSGENLDQALSFATRAAQHTADPRLKTSLSDTLGWIYLKKKMYDDAVQSFQSLVDNNPNNPTYLYHLGTTFYQKGDKVRARTQLDAALKAKPSPPVEHDIRDLLARL